MTNRASIEDEIRHLLSSETDGLVLFNKLFQQGTGLFTKLASNEAERRLLVQSTLFREAQDRAHDLLERDEALLDQVEGFANQHAPGVQLGLAISGNATSPIPTRAAS